MAKEKNLVKLPHSAQRKNAFLGEKEKALAAGRSDKKRTERTTWKYFGCGSENHFIAKWPNPPKDNLKQKNQVCFNEKGNRACDNGENNSDQKIDASMARMSGNNKFPSGKFGDSAQLTNWILDSGGGCHMTPEVSELLQGILKILINKLKLRTDITSQRKKNVK